MRLTLGIRYTDEERDYEYTNAIGSEGAVLSDFLLAVGAINPANNLIFDYSKGGADVIAGNRNRIDNDNLSGKIGLDWDVTEDIMLFATIGRGFKSGGFNAGFMDVDMQAARDNFGVNVQYDEETLTSYEVGIKSIWADGRLRVNATAFYYDYEDFQALSFFGISQFLVNSDADVKGGEIEIVAAPVDGLELQFGASFIDSNVDEVRDLNTNELLQDREMVLSPDFSMNGLARYEWGAFGGTLSMQADFNHQGDHFFDITNIDIAEEDSYTVWNARAAYRSGDEKWQVALFGKNLSDKEYRVYTFNFTGAGGFNQQFFAPPRWYGVNVSYSF
jgi:iron complex outermembrane receptor protein